MTTLASSARGSVRAGRAPSTARWCGASVVPCSGRPTPTTPGGDVPRGAGGLPAAAAGQQRQGLAGDDRPPQVARSSCAPRRGGPCRSAMRRRWPRSTSRPASTASSARRSAELPPKQRTAVVGRYLADLSYRDLAAMLGSSEAAARRSAADGIAKLRGRIRRSAAMSDPGARSPAAFVRRRAHARPACTTGSSPAPAAAGLLDVAYRTVDSPLGVAARRRHVGRVAARRVRRRGRRRGPRRAGRWSARGSSTIRRRLDTVATELDEYFSGRRRQFSVPLDLRLAHGFRHEVLEQLRRSPSGPRPATPRWPVPPARRGRCAPWARRVRRTRCRSSCPAIGWCAAMVRSAGIAAASRPSAGCSRWRHRERARSREGVAAGLDDLGVAGAARLLEDDECRAVAEMFADDERFRSTVDMAAHRFGEGRYRYFARPLPPTRRAAARRVLAAPVADRPRLGGPPRSPSAVARRPRRLARAVPRRRADPFHAAPAALRTGRLERAAPRPLRRPRVPVAGRRRAGRAWRRPHRRRVRRRRAAPAGAVAGDGDAIERGQGCGVHHPRPPGAVGAGLVGGTGAPRRQRGAHRHPRARSGWCSTTPADRVADECPSGADIRVQHAHALTGAASGRNPAAQRAHRCRRGEHLDLRRAAAPPADPIRRRRTAAPSAAPSSAGRPSESRTTVPAGRSAMPALHSTRSAGGRSRARGAAAPRRGGDRCSTAFGRGPSPATRRGRRVVGAPAVAHGR